MQQTSHLEQDVVFLSVVGFKKASDFPGIRVLLGGGKGGAGW